MKERPIIMTGDSVKAILDDRKTQTRRVITHCSVPNSDLVDFREFLYVSENNDAMSPNEGYYALFKCNANQNNGVIYFRCPYGQVGDRLWVRESFHATDKGHKVHYKAKDGEPSWMKWSPSIHMPHWASRILLEITEVRVERVQEITNDDVQSEGADTKDGLFFVGDKIFMFHKLWDSINAKRGYGWDTNPWVWVISFKRVI